MKTITKSQYLYLKSKKNAKLLKNETVTIEDEEYEDLIQYSNKQITPIDDGNDEPQEETYDYSECDFGIGQWGYNIISLEDRTVSIKYCGNHDTLTEVIIPETVEYNNVLFSVTSIGFCAFTYCTSLTNIDIPNSVTSIGVCAFKACNNITSINMSNSVTNICVQAFDGCTSLTNVNIPNSVTNIDDWAFGYCTSLTNIDIPNSVTSIGVCAFQDCTSLTNVNISNNITNIGDYTFRGCTSLTSIDIPNSVTSICFNAFEYCNNLISIIIYSGNIIFIDINYLNIDHIDHQITIYVLSELVNDYKSHYEKDIFAGKVNILPIE